MKPTQISTLIVVIVIGLTSGRAPLHAQSTSDNATLAAEDDTKPWSQGVPLANRQAAQALFMKGNQLFMVPLFAQAVEQYIAALAQWKHPAFYFNLALAQRNLGQDVEARNSFEQALKHGEEPLGTKLFQAAQKQLENLEHKLGRIHITCPTQGAEVTLDGTSLFTGPGSYEGWVTAKPHEITARKPEYLPQARRLTISSGELKSLNLSLVTLGEAAENGRRWTPWKPWAVIGFGAVVGAVSGGLHVLSKSTFSNYDARFLRDCPMGCFVQQTSHQDNLLNRATREQEIAVTGYIIGGSAIAAGAVLLYMNRPRLVEQEATSSQATSMIIAPTVSPGAVGVLVTVSH